MVFVLWSSLNHMSIEYRGLIKKGDRITPSYLQLVRYVDLKVRETFELNELKSAPSKLLPVLPGIYRLQTCCHSFGPANILQFFQVPANFFFIVMTTGQELGHLISKPVFQQKLWNAIMKQKLRMFAIHQTATSLQQTYNLNPRTTWYPTLDELNRMKSAYFKIHPGKNPPPQNGCQLKSRFF
jgi:hypothetical protein